MKNKELQKVYERIESLISENSKSILDFKKYVNELIDKGNYYLFEEVLDRYYNINTSKFSNVLFNLDTIWKNLKFKSNDDISIKIKKILDDNNVYQVGTIIYNNDNIKLGEIKEVYYLDIGYNYVINNEFSKLTGLKKVYLDVKKINEDSVLIDTDNKSINYRNNLINRYKLAISYLISN
jgi:hypothetical protein